MSFPEVRTDRLLLRSFRDSDAPALAAYRADPETAAYQSWPLPYTLADARAFIAELADLSWPLPDDWYQIAVEHDGAMIGDLAVGRSERGLLAEIGYTLAPSARGQGLAREGVTALIDLLVADGVHRVSAGVDPENQASAKLLQSLGFRYEGRSVAAVLVRERWCDDDRFALLADEWRRRR